VSFTILAPKFLPGELPFEMCGYLEDDPDADESIRLIYEYPPRLHLRYHRDLVILVDEWKTAKLVPFEAVVRKKLSFESKEIECRQVVLRNTSGLRFLAPGNRNSVLWQENGILYEVTCHFDSSRSKISDFGFESCEALLLKVAESLSPADRAGEIHKGSRA
jgi:hypothetical protein